MKPTNCRSDQECPYQIETLHVPYRKPVWKGSDKMELLPAEMEIHKVAVRKRFCGYPLARELARKLGVAPELIRRLLREPDAPDEPEATNRILVAPDPGIIVEEEEAVMDLFQQGVPVEAYDDVFQLLIPVAFDREPQNGWLVRLTDCEFVSEPRIDIAGEPGLRKVADEEELFYEENEGAVIMDEGEYLTAKLQQSLRLNSLGARLPWDANEFLSLYTGVPYVKQIVWDFKSGKPLPETWVRLNLAYAMRMAYFLRRRLGDKWPSEADSLDRGIGGMIECCG
jgi:hypothetical protein